MHTLPDLATVTEDLSLLPDWEARYGYLIDLAHHLPPLPDDARTEANKVRGCTSQVWLTAWWDTEDTLHLHLDSDALIVKGLLALVYIAYVGKSRVQVRGLDLAAHMADTQLLQNLSPNRRNGFASVLARIKALPDQV